MRTKQHKRSTLKLLDIQEKLQHVIHKNFDEKRTGFKNKIANFITREVSSMIVFNERMSNNCDFDKEHFDEDLKYSKNDACKGTSKLIGKMIKWSRRYNFNCKVGAENKYIRKVENRLRKAKNRINKKLNC